MLRSDIRLSPSDIRYASLGGEYNITATIGSNITVACNNITLTRSAYHFQFNIAFVSTEAVLVKKRGESEVFALLVPRRAKIFRRAACERAPRRLSAQMRTHICCADVSSHQYSLAQKIRGLQRSPLIFCGGESEIRTHGTVLAFTRFPVVRLRPAQPSLHIDLTIIPQENIKIKSFFKKNLKN